MSLVIVVEPPDRPDLAPLFAASEAFSAALYPPASRHLVAPDALSGPGVTFLVARLDGLPTGIGAVLCHGADAAEVKRMFVSEPSRGRGIGRALLAALEQAASGQGARLVRLETGVHSAGALRLYRAAGYVERGPFAAYRLDPLSLFMEKRLPPA